MSTQESRLKVSIDGSEATQGSASVEAGLRKMNDEGVKSSSIFTTLTSTLQQMGSSAFGSINNGLHAMGSIGQSAIGSVTAALQSMTNAASNAAGAIGGGGGSGGGIVGALGALGSAASGVAGILKDLISIDLILSFAKTVFDVSNRLQGFVSTMSVVTGSMGAARDELNYIFSVANRWGASVDSVTASYAKLAAAAKGTSLEGQGVRQVFESVTQATVALHLSAQDTTLVFFALQQMVSKGKVSMEELRKQLAERFPGAIQIAAESLNVTVDVMEKMIKKGEVLAADFLPKFAAGIEKAFGDAATLASKSLLAEINRLKNAWEAFLMKLAESGVIEKASEAVRVLTAMLNNNSDVSLMIGDIISKLIGHITTFLSTLKPEQIQDFFGTLAKFAGIVVDVFGGLIKATIWLVDVFGPLVKLVGGSLVDAFGALRTIVMAVIDPITKLGALFRGEISFKEWISGSEKAAEATKKFGYSNDDARDRMARLANETARKVEIDERNLKNAQNALADSNRLVDIKTKEITVFQRLNEITRERINLQAQVDDPTLDINDRVRAINALITLNKEYGTVKANADKEASKMSKEAVKDLNAQWKATETYVATLEKEQFALTHSRIEEAQRAAAIAVSTIRIKADRDAMFDHLVAMIATTEQLKHQQEEQKALQKIYEDYIKDYDKQIEGAEKALQKAKEENEQIGKSKASIELLRVARDNETISKLEGVLASKEILGICTEETEKLKTLIELLKQRRTLELDSGDKFAQVDFNKSIESANDKLKKDFEKTSSSIGDSLTDALLRGFEKGEGFAENFKTTMINMFKTMILKPIIQPILSDAVGSLANLLGIKANPNGGGFTFGGGSSSSFFNLGGNNNGGSGGGFDFGSLANNKNSFFGNLFGGNYSGNNDPNMGPIEGIDWGTMFKDGVSQGIAGAGIGSAVGSLASEFFGNERNKTGIQAGATIGATIGMMTPLGPIGALIGAVIGALIGSLLKSGGGPKGGGFFASGETPGITGTDDKGRWFTPTTRDKDVRLIVEATATSYNTLLKALGGTGHASFALGFDTDPKGTAPNRTHTGVFMNGQQIYDSQQSDLGRDPEVLKAALETEAKRSLLAALQASNLPTYIADMLKDLDPKTMDAGDIDKILDTVVALKTAVDVFGELGGKLKALNPAQVQAFVEIFGSLEEFTQAFGFLNDNFVTGAQKQERAMVKLTDGFKAINIEIPQSHQAFLDLLDSIDITTAEGQELYHTIALLAPTFVQVYGTADQAAQALGDFAGALADLVQQGQEFFDENFLSDSEKQAKRLGNDWSIVHKAWKDVGSILLELGMDHIPTTNEGFKQLIQSIDRTTPAGEALYQRLIVISPAIWDLNTALEATNQAVIDATEFFNENFYSDNEKAAARIKAAWTKVHNAWTQFGSQLMELGYKNIPTTNEGFRAMIENLRSLGLDELADSMILLAPTIFGLNADIETLGETASGVSPELQRLRDNIRDFLDSLKIGDLSPLTPEQKLMEAQGRYLDALKKAQGGDLDAMAKLPDLAQSYLSLARDFYASSQQYTDIFNSVTGALEALISTTGDVPVPTTDLTPLNAVLPSDGKIASDKDIEALADRIIDGLRFYARETVEATQRSGSNIGTVIESQSRKPPRGSK